MKQRSFQTWVLVALTFWGIPAALFLVGIDFCRKNFERWQLSEREKTLNLALNSLIGNSDKAVEARLNEGFERLTRFGIGEKRLEDEKKSFAEMFPPGLIRFYLFDSRGKLLLNEEPRLAQTMQRVFEYVRRPWSEAIDPAQVEFQELEGFLPDPGQISRMRSQEGKIHLLGDADPGSPFFINGFYRWNQGAAGKKVAGMLAFLDYRHLSEKFLLEAGLAATNISGTGFGYGIEGAGVNAPAGMSEDRFRELIAKYRNFPANRLVFDTWLAKGASYRPSSLVFAVIRIPRSPFWAFAAVFLVYVVLSAGCLRRLYRVIHQRTMPVIPLREKLGFLFFLGVALPLIATVLPAWLYLENKKEEIILRNQETAFGLLDQIDAGYEKALAERQVFYQSIGRDFSAGKLNEEGMITVFKELQQQCLLDDFFMVSSEPMILRGNQSRSYSDIKWMLHQPLKERLVFFQKILSHRRGFPTQAEADCFYDRVSSSTLEHRIPKLYRDRWVKIFPKLGADAMAYSNLLNGVEGIRRPADHPPKTSDLLLEDLSGIEGQTLFSFLKLSLGKILMGSQGSHANIFVDVLKDARGEAQYFIGLSHQHLCFQRTYLDRVFSENRRRSGDYELRAIGWQLKYSPSYPMEENDPYQALHEQLVQTGVERRVTRTIVGGEEVEVVIQKGKTLVGFDLLHVTRASTIAGRLVRYRNRILIFIAGTSLFSFLLGWLLLQKFLVPLQALVAGVNALRRKDFGHQVKVRSKDEFGRLCGVLNDAIRHMGEMEVASAIQKTLYPDGPLRMGNVEIIGKNIMTQAIGGDYFDYFRLSEEKVAVILGDVSGHGLSAALVTAMAKAGFTILCPLFPDDPRTVLLTINKQFLDVLNKAKMMTCQLGLLDEGHGVG